MGSKQGGQSVLNDLLSLSFEYAWFYLKKYCNAPKELGWLQNAKIVNKNAPLTNQMKLSGKEAGEVKRR